MRRHFLWIVFVVAGVSELGLLFDLIRDRHLKPHELLWPYLGTMLLFIVLPATMAAMWARIQPRSKFLRRRFAVSPFSTIKVGATLNGASVARSLLLELSAWQGSTRKLGSHTESSPVSGAAFSYAGATLPLPLIWHTLRSIIIGSDIRLEGMIDESSDAFTITVWAEDAAGLHCWQESLIPGNSLPTVMSTLAERILEEFEDFYFVGHMYWSKERYHDAIRFLQSGERTCEICLDLATLYTVCHQYEEAKEQLRLAGESKGRDDAALAAIAERRTSVHINLKEYEQAIETVKQERLRQKTGRYPTAKTNLHKLSLTLASAYAYSGHYDDAVAEYRLAATETKERLAALLGLKTSVTQQDLFQAILKYGRYERVSQEILNALWSLFEAYNTRGEIEMLRDGGDPLPAYDDANSTLTVLMKTDDPVQAAYRRGIVQKNVAYFYERKNDMKNAIEGFNQAERSFEFWLAQIGGTESFQERNVIVDFAWSLGGTYACKCRRILAQQSLESRPMADISSEVSSAMAALLHLIRRLELSAREVIESTWDQARNRVRRRHNEKYLGTITKAAAMVADAVFRTRNETLIEEASRLARDVIFEPRLELHDLCRTIRQAAESVALNPGTLVEGLKAVALGDSAAAREHDFEVVYTGLCYLMNFVTIKVPKRAAAEVAIDIERQLDADETFDRSLEAFDRLMRRGEIPDRAEAFYGAACVFAARQDVNAACDNLYEAIAITSPESAWASEYLNRAKVDPDFGAIRLDPTFQRLLAKEDGS